MICSGAGGVCMDKMGERSRMEGGGRAFSGLSTVRTRPAGRLQSGQGVLEISRVGSGRVRKFSSSTGRAGLA